MEERERGRDDGRKEKSRVEERKGGSVVMGKKRRWIISTHNKNLYSVDPWKVHNYF